MKILSAAVFISGSLCILCSNFLVDFASATQAVPKPDQKNLKGGVKNAPLQQRKGSVPINPPKPVNDKLKDGSNKTETKNAKNTLSKPPMQVTDKSKDEAKKTPLQSTPKLTPKTKEVPKESNMEMWLKDTKDEYENLKCQYRTCLYDWFRKINDEYNELLNKLEEKWAKFPNDPKNKDVFDNLKTSSLKNDEKKAQWMRKNLKDLMREQVDEWLEGKKKIYEGMSPTYWDAWEKKIAKGLMGAEWYKMNSSGRTKEWDKLRNELETRYNKKIKSLWGGFHRDVYFRFKEWIEEVFNKWIENKQIDTWMNSGKK
ncbi:unnamed protein product [Plasmodium vivax]|uniref:Tryptophan/threonine-rich plasmodium antigen C-terminal domain-containing protein n=4 Tax=Plasmodium vivax TaxID=5855 RepID=A0A0J9TMI9_PLAVI|nr:hypothetical protein PVIIG_05152 [Plasmodium vivax India VII]KMZ95967.1 hypothetical protein PVNG_02818 [Plasmodium vivax North Korean]CAG9485427.1 unnamed protein product [Plasmodium vivax]